MGLISISASASLSFFNLSINSRNPILHQFGFISSSIGSPLRTSSHLNFLLKSHLSSSEKYSRYTFLNKELVVIPSTSPESIHRSICRRVGCSLLKVEEDVNDETCELVSGIELSVGEGEDSINAHLFKAVKNNNGTGILLLSDIFGFEDSSTREFAYRVACNGYNVLLPDLFRGDPWTKHKPKNLFDEWILKQEPQRVAKDIATSAKWMVDEFSAVGISKKLGLVGFCFGGGKVIDVLARDQDAYFGVGVSFYGTRMNTSVPSEIKVPVLFISGDSDPLCPITVLENIEKNIGKGSRLVIFEGRGHGFAHRPQSAEEDEDAEKAFTIMRNWLEDGLVAPTE